MHPPASTSLIIGFRFGPLPLYEMSQSNVSSSSTSSHKFSGLQDIDITSIHAKLRSSKQQQDQSQTPAEGLRLPSQLSHLQSSPVEVSQAAKSTPARMTRKRAAHVTNLEEVALHKSLDEVVRHTIDDSASLIGSISQICLCQPDPKVPRPRNGEFTSKKNRKTLFVPVALYTSAFYYSGAG
jgi:hypothetical protein